MAAAESWVLGDVEEEEEAVVREEERPEGDGWDESVDTDLPCPRPMNIHPSSAHSEHVRSEEIVVGHSVSFPGCLSSIVTLTLPLEQRVLRFKEEFTNSVYEIRSRLSVLIGRSADVEEQMVDVAQRTDEVEKDVKEVQRQTSDLSERLESSMTECERRQEEVEQQAVGLELRTTILESSDSKVVTNDMKKLAQQMEEMKERLTLAESDAAKAKITSDDLQAERLMERLLSLENKFQSRFHVSNSGQPLRSFSHP